MDPPRRGRGRAGRGRRHRRMGALAAHPRASVLGCCLRGGLLGIPHRGVSAPLEAVRPLRRIRATPAARGRAIRELPANGRCRCTRSRLSGRSSRRDAHCSFSTPAPGTSGPCRCGPCSQRPSSCCRARRWRSPTAPSPSPSTCCSRCSGPYCGAPELPAVWPSPPSSPSSPRRPPVIVILFLPLLAIRVIALRRFREHAVTAGWLAGCLVQLPIVIMSYSQGQSRLTGYGLPGGSNNKVGDSLTFYAHDVILRAVGWHLSWRLEWRTGRDSATVIVAVVLAAVFAVIMATQRGARPFVVTALLTGFVFCCGLHDPDPVGDSLAGYDPAGISRSLHRASHLPDRGGGHRRGGLRAAECGAASASGSS